MSTFNEPEWDSVTPNLEHVPKRTYKRDGSAIKCYNIPSYQKPEIHDELPMLVFDVGTDAIARTVMKDLYYGEYTGA